jgi:MscS family membrane protein
MLGLLNNQYFIAILIILLTIGVTKLTKKLINKLIKASSKTKTKLDNILAEHINSPLQIIILTIGFFFAFKYIYPDFQIGNINIEQIFTVIWILAGALLINKITNALFVWYTDELQHKLKHKIDNNIFHFIQKIVNVMIYLFAIIMILSNFGVEITPLLAGLGIGGLAIALALKDTLANFFGALFIAIDRPLKIGDYIELSDSIGGHVKDIGWRTTRIKTWDGNYIIIPNAQIADSKLKNYNAPRTTLTFSIDCGVSYNDDLDKVEKVVIDVAKKVLKKDKSGVNDFVPFVRFKQFGDSSINFATYFEVKDRSDKFRVRHEFIKALHKKFIKEKIEIPFPQIEVHNIK